MPETFWPKIDGWSGIVPPTMFYLDMRILFLGFVVNVSWSLPNVDIFIRTLHPDVKFHQKRLKDAKNDLERQIEEFSLSNRVKFHDLTSKKENYYTGQFLS